MRELTEAARSGDEARVGALLERGGLSGEDLLDALCQAAYEGHVGALQQLVKAGADVNGKSASGGWSPLHFAVDNLQLETARTLLDLGANVDQADPSGWTPLHHAVDVESDATAEGNAMEWQTGLSTLLLDRGANPDAADSQGVTPTEIALDYGNLTVARLIRAHSRSRQQESEGGSEGSATEG